jgi:hypothetical protein
MKTFGIKSEQKLVSVNVNKDGNPVISMLQPNPKPENWVAPELIPLVKIDKPEKGEWEPTLVWFEDRVERQWVQQ